MKILYKSSSIFMENRLELDGLIETLVALGGIGRFRGENPPIGGNENLNLFEIEEFKCQFDFEPTLIISDIGEYGSCFLTIYSGNDDFSFFEYVYRWKGSLLKESGKIDLKRFENKIK